MSTEHARIEELISALQDGAASPAEQALVERHVATCPSCRATVEAFGRNDERLRRYLQATPVPPIDSPWLEAARTRGAGHPLAGGGARNWRVALAGLVTVLVLALGAAWYMQRQAGTADRQAASQAPEAANKPVATVAADQANRSAASGGPAASAATGGPAVAAGPTSAAAGAPATAAATRPPAPPAAAGSPAAGAVPTRAASAAGAASPTPAPRRINPAQRHGPP